MSVVRGRVRPRAILSDDAIERTLVMLRSHLEPDPLFRRRLRGTVSNRFVAAREGLGDASASRRSMGRLGRAVLYASFALAASATSVMAASQAALPGDALYSLKRQIEAFRVQVLPEHFQDDLAAAELRQRITEMEALVERGDWERVTALAALISDGYDLLLVDPDMRADGNLAVLGGLLEKLPPQARIAMRGVMEGMPGISQRRSPPDVSPGAGANAGNETDAGVDSSRPGIAPPPSASGRTGGDGTPAATDGADPSGSSQNGSNTGATTGGTPSPNPSEDADDPADREPDADDEPEGEEGSAPEMEPGG